MIRVDCAIFEGSNRLYYGVAEATFGSGEHGDEGATLRLAIPRYLSFLLYTRLSASLQVRITASGDRAFVGRVEDVAINDDGATVQALGYWRAFDDLEVTTFWSKATWDDFREAQQDDATIFRPERFAFGDSEDGFYISPSQTGGTYAITGANTAVGTLTYEVPSASGRLISGAQFRMELVAVANWRGQLATANRDFSGAVAINGFTHAGANVSIGYHLTFTAAPRVRFDFFANSAGGLVLGVNPGDYYARFTRMRLVSASTNRVNTTLTANRAAGASVTATVGSTAGMYVGMDLVINSTAFNSEIVTVESITSATQFVATFVNAYIIGNPVQGFRILGDEIAADLVSVTNAANPTQISSSTALIQSPGLDLLNAVYEDRTPASILNEITGFGGQNGDRWEVGVDEDQRLYLRPQDSNATQTWFVDVADLQVQQTIDQLVTSTYGVYQRADGFTLRTSNLTDANAVTRYGLTRRRAIQASTNNVTVATRIAQTALNDNNVTVPRATFTTTRVYTASGANAPVWFVRAGDTVTIRNLPAVFGADIDRIRTFRLFDVEIDATTGTISMTPETPLPELEYLLARQATFGAQVGDRLG